MTQWIYKATRLRATYADMHHLATEDHFLCRSAFAHGPSPEHVHETPLVREVAVGDVIHYFYRTPEARVRALGTFRVVDAGGFAGALEPCLGHGALVQVVESPENAAMIGRLRRGYWHDPKLGLYTGWAIERAPADVHTPGFDQAKMLPSLTTTLWRYPDEGLPRRVAPVTRAL